MTPDREAGGALYRLHGGVARNPGTALALHRLASIRVNRSAVERRAASLPARRAIKRDTQAGWLLRAVTCMDLTTLGGDDTPARVRRLCAKARHPVRADLLAALAMPQAPVRVAAVCVYPEMVATARAALTGSDIPVAAVAGGFPHGLSPLAAGLEEIRMEVAEGAAEIDIVIRRGDVLTGNWQALYDRVAEMRAACGPAHLKVILATGELATLANIARASMVAMMAGADFIKTSTGKEGINATLPVSLTMVRMIRRYRELTGHLVGFKPAGGISRARDALAYLAMMKDELGAPFLSAELFRFGASGLLGDIERQLAHHATGRYSAGFRHPAA